MSRFLVLSCVLCCWFLGTLAQPAPSLEDRAIAKVKAKIVQENPNSVYLMKNFVNVNAVTSIYYVSLLVRIPNASGPKHNCNMSLHYAAPPTDVFHENALTCTPVTP